MIGRSRAGGFLVVAMAQRTFAPAWCGQRLSARLRTSSGLLRKGPIPHIRGIPLLTSNLVQKSANGMWWRPGACPPIGFQRKPVGRAAFVNSVCCVTRTEEAAGWSRVLDQSYVEQHRDSHEPVAPLLAR